MVPVLLAYATPLCLRHAAGDLIQAMYDLFVQTVLLMMLMLLMLPLLTRISGGRREWERDRPCPFNVIVAIEIIVSASTAIFIFCNACKLFPSENLAYSSRIQEHSREAPDVSFRQTR